MAGYVETTPESTRLQALGLALQLNIAGVQAPAVIGLDVIEQLCPNEPGNGGEYDACQMTQ